MTPENTQKLLDAAPTVFGDSFGFECADGWTDLILKLATEIEALNVGLPDDQRCSATQVKEKFGGLRFYVDQYSDAVDALIAAAEHSSYGICESCGAPGTLGGRGWRQTLCKPCREEDRK